jgi:hypothetical protein
MVVMIVQPHLISQTYTRMMFVMVDRQRIESDVDWGEGLVFSKDYENLNKDVENKYFSILLKQFKLFLVQYDNKLPSSMITQLLFPHLDKLLSIFRTAKRNDLTKPIVSILTHSYRFVAEELDVDEYDFDGEVNVVKDGGGGGGETKILSPSPYTNSKEKNKNVKKDKDNTKMNRNTFLFPPPPITLIDLAQMLLEMYEWIDCLLIELETAVGNALEKLVLYIK